MFLVESDLVLLGFGSESPTASPLDRFDQILPRANNLPGNRIPLQPSDSREPLLNCGARGRARTSGHRYREAGELVTVSAGAQPASAVVSPGAPLLATATTGNTNLIGRSK